MAGSKRVLLCAVLLLGLISVTAAAPLMNVPAKKVQAKPMLRAKLTCQMYPQYEDNEYRFNQYQCNVASFYPTPVCIALNCVNVVIGKPPIGGSGAGTNIIRPGPHSDNIGQNCTSMEPVYPPNGAWYFNFLVVKDSPVRVTVANVYPPPSGNSC